jgi:hypothetical protein
MVYLIGATTDKTSLFNLVSVIISDSLEHQVYQAKLMVSSPDRVSRLVGWSWAMNTLNQLPNSEAFVA